MPNQVDAIAALMPGTPSAKDSGCTCPENDERHIGDPSYVWRMSLSCPTHGAKLKRAQEAEALDA